MMQDKKYDTVIWDLDGTLLDTLEDLKDSVNFAMREYGYAERTLEDIRVFVGNGVKKLVELAIPGGADNPKYPEVYDVFCKYYEKHNMDKTKPYDGIVEVIRELKDRGVKQAIVSNKVHSGVQTLNHAFFNVDFAIGVQEGLERKPAPDMVLKALRELGADTSRTVYIGDSEVDLKTASNAGLDCLSVLWGFRKREELEPFLPMCMISTPKEVLNFIK